MDESERSGQGQEQPNRERDAGSDVRGGGREGDPFDTSVSYYSDSMEVEKRVRVDVQSVEAIPDLKIIKPKVFPDERGFFSETYNAVEWKELLAFDHLFLQDNHSFSVHGVVRGLHSQPGMGKLVSVVKGRIFDVAVDARPGSATFGQWHGVYLDGVNKHAFWIPPGFLHGFQCLSEEGAHVTYKCSAVYDPNTEYGISPFDEDIAVAWPLSKENSIVSERDQVHPPFSSLLNK